MQAVFFYFHWYFSNMETQITKTTPVAGDKRPYESSCDPFIFLALKFWRTEPHGRCYHHLLDKLNSPNVVGTELGAALFVPALIEMEETPILFSVWHLCLNGS